MSTSALRARAPQVGLAVRESRSTAVVAPGAPSTSAFDARIMHRPVPAALTDIVVTVDASDAALARALRVPLELVQSEWLTSRSEITDPRGTLRGRSHMRAPPVSLDTLQRFRDLSEELRARLQDLFDDDASAVATPAHRARYYAPQPKTHRGAPRIAPLPQVEFPGAADRAARALELRLADRGFHVGEAPSAPSCVGEEDLSSEEASDVTSVDPEEDKCGFSVRDRHADLALSCDRAMIVKTGGGLYRTARHAHGIGRGESFYAELYVNYSGGIGGIAAGVCTSGMPLQKMVGGEQMSMGVHSGASTVRSGVWESDGKKFGTGDVLGMLVRVSEKGEVVLSVSINGEDGKVITDKTLNAAVAKGERVHLAVSLYRVGARVSLKCCPRDWNHVPYGEEAEMRPLCQRLCASVANTSTVPENNTQKTDAQPTSVLTP